MTTVNIPTAALPLVIGLLDTLDVTARVCVCQMVFRLLRFGRSPGTHEEEKDGSAVSSLGRDRRNVILDLIPPSDQFPDPFLALSTPLVFL